MRIPGRPNPNCMLKLCLDGRLGTLTFQIHFETASSVKGIYCCKKVPSMQNTRKKSGRKKGRKEGRREERKGRQAGKKAGREGWGKGRKRGREGEIEGGRGGRSTH